MTYGPIEKNIPMPSRCVANGGRRKSALYTLEVGDSVLVTGVKQTKVSSIAYNIGKSTGRKFATRVVEGGVRVWRLE